MSINPRAQAVAGVLAYPSVGALPLAPDLAVICTPAPTVPDLVAELGRRGTRAIIVLSAGLGAPGTNGQTWRAAALAAARPNLVRLLGPNCVGLAVPGLGLNASFAHAAPLPGRLAFVSQSGALCTAVLDWARAKGIGFSHFVSLGDAADVDFGDVVDVLASEPDVDAILLYIESITGARKFMSAARAAARNKPVVAVKAGRGAEGARAALSHTGALAGEDIVYEAALARAGILRVRAIDELFAAVETLARATLPKGDALAVLTNGGGPGVMAVDALVEEGGRLAVLTPETIARLDTLLPPTWSHGNPVDIIGDAPAERYTGALEVLLAAPEVDAVLVLNAPTAMASSRDAAQAVAAARSSRCLLTSWLGAETAEPARRLFAEARVPTYDTPERAVRAFHHIRAYQTNQILLTETPPSIAPEERPAEALALVEQALREGRTILSEPEAKALLAAYGVPVVPSRLARDAAEAQAIAAELGGPVALKVLSPDISHKTDVGGVVLDLATPEAVRAAAIAMAERVGRLVPDARLDGFIV
jgi:acetyltransferase